MRHALLLLLLSFPALTGCYVAARVGPQYSFDGDRRGTAVEVVVGTEVHASPLDASPLDRRYALSSEMGVQRADAAGGTRWGGSFGVGAAVLWQVQRGRRTTEVQGSATFLRADLRGTVGKLALDGDDSDVGTFVRALALVEGERYVDGWAVRLGAGVMTQTVVVADPEGTEGSIAPVVALTVELTPVLRRVVRALVSR